MIYNTNKNHKIKYYSIEENNLETTQILAI